MDPASMLLIVQLVAQGIGVAKEIKELAKRVERGENITQEDISKARAEIDKVVSAWDTSVKPTLINNGD